MRTIASLVTWLFAGLAILASSTLPADPASAPRIDDTGDIPTKFETATTFNDIEKREIMVPMPGL